MRIEKVEIKGFKRFTDTSVVDIPKSARLVIIAGPNGSGKSSFFDALQHWSKVKANQYNWDETYHSKATGLAALAWNEMVDVTFHDLQPSSEKLARKAVYVRTAYRNEPEFKLEQIKSVGSALDEKRVARLIDNDQAVKGNYQRLVGQAFEDVFENEDGSTTITEFRNKVIGEIKAATSRLFPDLIMNSLGNPLTNGTFKFSKGVSNGFQYKNLSGGEKSAFDLILDMLVKRVEFDDTVFCIDEPEAHMNTRLQGKLLRELFGLIEDKNQLWLATHSVGMMREARDLAKARPGEVVFLDFGDRDFDKVQKVSPEQPTRAFWERVLSVAFDDMASLVAPAQIILCEGSPIVGAAKHEAIDAACYNEIFASGKPDCKFVSVGNASSVESDRLAVMATLNAVISGSTIIRLVDRDDLSENEVDERIGAGIRVLGRRNLESYLFDDEIIRKLSAKVGYGEFADDIILSKQEAIASAIQRGRPADDIKAAAGDIFNAIRRKLKLTQCGNTVKTFMRDTLAPLVPGTMIYNKMEHDIFSG